MKTRLRGFVASVVLPFVRSWILKYKTVSLTHTHTWVVVDEALVDGGQLLSTDVSGGVGRRLEVQVVFALDEKLGRSHVHANHHFVCEARLLDGRLDELQG